MHLHVLRSNLLRGGQFTDVPAEEDLLKFYEAMVQRADPRVARGNLQSYNLSRSVLVGMLEQRGLPVDGVILDLSARLRADDARLSLGGLAPFVPARVPARDGDGDAAQPRRRTYAIHSKKNLIALCAGHGLDSTGTAAALRARLVEHDSPAAAGGGDGSGVVNVAQLYGDALVGGGDDVPGGVVDGDAFAGGGGDDAPGGVVVGGDALAGGGDDAHGGVVVGGDAIMTEAVISVAGAKRKAPDAGALRRGTRARYE